MADTAAADAPKASYDAQGREVFTVHPQILGGGAPYRKITTPEGPEGEPVAARRRGAPSTGAGCGQLTVPGRVDPADWPLGPGQPRTCS